MLPVPHCNWEANIAATFYSIETLLHLNEAYIGNLNIFAISWGGKPPGVSMRLGESTQQTASHLF